MWEEVFSNNKNAFVLIVLPLAAALLFMYCLKLMGVKIFGGGSQKRTISDKSRRLSYNENKNLGTKKRND